jgi:AcrR family transcriptional regulator
MHVLKSEPEAGVSMDRIAQAAGVGKATLYRYFDTKEELMRACLQEVIDELGRRMEAAEETCEPVPERLVAIVTCMVETFSDHLLPLRMVTRHNRELDDTWRWWVRDARRRLVAVLHRHFERGQRGGTYHGVDMDLVPQMVMGMIRSGVFYGESDTSGDLSARISAFILRGCCTEASAGAVATRSGLSR